MPLTAPLLAAALLAGPAPAADLPAGTTDPAPIFDGESFDGWFFAPHTDPRSIAAMTPSGRAAFLAEHRAEGLEHWRVEPGDGGPELVNDGEGPFLWTDRDYLDFELSLDWKITAAADSGVYVRGCPQVQIWDPDSPQNAKHNAAAGSGGLWNNPKTGPNGRGKDPSERADNPIGEWNRFVIRVVGSSVTVDLNGVRVVNEATLENYWDRALPLFPAGPIILQTHGGETRWRNLSVREIPRAMPESGFLTADGEPYGEGWDVPPDRLVVVPPAGALHATIGPLGGETADLVSLVRTGASPAPLRFRSSAAGVDIDNPLARVAALAPDGPPDPAAGGGPIPGLRVDLPALKAAFAADGENRLFASNAVGALTLYMNGVPFLTAVAADGEAAGANPIGVTGRGRLRRLQWSDESRELSSSGQPAPPPDEIGFTPVPLTSGLPGWTGDVDGYVAAGGILTCRGGGNLYLPGDHDDFALRFEFRLPPGGNNGVGLRAKRGANAAYEGMESQILDNTAAGFAGIQPWQTHGSIYGVVPAVRGALAPVGHWNREEIRCEGDRVTVTLNGVVIVDADVRAAAADGTPDGRPHPGLLNDSGAVGFLGHGAPVAWRNVRVRDLSAAVADEPAE